MNTSQIVIGILPVILFAFIDREVNLFRRDISDGMLPVNLFLSSFNPLSSTNIPSSFGSDPDKLLLEKFSVSFNPFKLPTSEGIVPLKLLFWSSNMPIEIKGKEMKGKRNK